MLTRARFGDQAGLSHLFGEQSLTEHIVYLMRARVVQILALEVYFCAAEVFGDLFCVVKQRRSACVAVEQLRQLAVEFGVVLKMIISLLQLNNGVHQCFGNVLPAVYAEASVFVCHA